MAWRMVWFFFFSSRRRHTRCYRDWSSDVCSSDLVERQVLSVGLHPPELAVERASAEPDALVDEDVRRDVIALALEPETRRPRLRRPQLEHPESAPVGDIAVEQDFERVTVREPIRVVPTKLAVDEGEHCVDRVVRLVPPLGAGLLEPPLRLPKLLGRARQLAVEHERDPVGGAAERAAAAGAVKCVPVGPELAAAERAAEDLEELHPAVNLPCRARRLSAPKHPTYVPRLR